mgnify:FL=1
MVTAILYIVDAKQKSLDDESIIYNMARRIDNMEEMIASAEIDVIWQRFANNERVGRRTQRRMNTVDRHIQAINPLRHRVDIHDQLIAGHSTRLRAQEQRGDWPQLLERRIDVLEKVISHHGVRLVTLEQDLNNMQQSFDAMEPWAPLLFAPY